MNETGSRPTLPDEGDRKFVVALARGLEVLRAFRPTDGFLGNQEIAERTGLARPTVTRLTYTLCELGYLAKVPRIGKYRLAPTAITLGYSALAGFGIRRLARPFMDRVVERAGAPVALAVVDRDAALYVDLSRGTAAFTIQLEIGSRLPIATTAIGRALFAALPSDQQTQLLEVLKEIHGADWPSVRAGLDESIKEYASRRYVTSTASWRADVHAVAVPLVARDGSGIYGFNCGGPPHQFTSDFMHGTVGPALLQMVASIEDVLDGSLV
jgi:DNA-binding IclR family transcriptional regulator